MIRAGEEDYDSYSPHTDWKAILATAGALTALLHGLQVILSVAKQLEDTLDNAEAGTAPAAVAPSWGVKEAGLGGKISAKLSDMIAALKEFFAD
jgi:hypothetical protein